jgi:hypothetical protein
MPKVLVKLENKKRKTSHLVTEFIVITVALVLLLSIMTPSGVQIAKAEKIILQYRASKLYSRCTYDYLLLWDPKVV